MAETNLAEGVIGDQSLTSSNYENWKVYMHNFLSDLNLWGIVNGTESEPDAADKYNTWVMKNEMALNAIKTSCGPEMVHHLQGITSAKEAWDLIASKHPPASSSAEENGVFKERQHGDDAVPETEDSVSGEPDYIRFRPFYKALIKGDWETAKEIIEDDPEALRAKITQAGETALHVAVLFGKLSTVKELLKLLPPEALEAKSSPGNPAISIAASLGVTEIAKLIVKKNNGVLQITNQHGQIPLVGSVLNGKGDMVRYLYSVTPKEELDPSTSKNGATFLTGAITAEMYDIALDALELYPELAISEDLFGKTAIAELARKSSAFPSGSRFGFWQKWIYSSCVAFDGRHGSPKSGFSEELVTDVKSFPRVSPPRTQFPIGIRIPEESPPRISPPRISTSRMRSREEIQEIIYISKLRASSGSRFGSWLQHLYTSCLCVVPGVMDIQKRKIKHFLVLILLEVVCTAIGRLTVEELKEGKVDDAIHLTATNGNIEVFMGLLDANPSLIYAKSASKRTLYHQAVMSRQVIIFNFISSIGQRDSRANDIDESHNTLLHFAGVLPSPSQLDKISGAALQMQRELQWFQAVEKIVLSKIKEFRNLALKTPAQVFTEEHKALKKDGEAWMKETANAGMLVSALIATVMFAAAFTVPGGNVESTGTPFFLKTPAFTIFIVSDAISLFASCTSILMFFAILTARYAEHDFLKSLPKKLIIGLASLFISIAGMMAAFGATLVIVLRDRVTWVTIPVTLLAIVLLYSDFYSFPYSLT